MEKLDFISIYKQYKEKLNNGDRALIKRAVELEDLEMLPAFYKLLGSRANKQWTRVIYFMPYAEHQKDARNIGQILYETKISEQRIFQVVRSESPNDLVQLRRLLKQAKPKVNWQKFGEMLFYWGNNQKKQLARDFFINQPDKEQNDE